MATNEIHIGISDNTVNVPLSVGSRSLLRTVEPDDGSPYYVGARAYVTQTASGATITIIDKDGTTTATVDNGADGQDGADGNGIADISLTSTSGNVDTYTITYTDGTTDTFDVTNGVDGQDGHDGADGQDGADGFSPTATVSKVGDTATITITDLNGTTTATVQDGTQANAFTAEYDTTTYADVKDAYDNDAILICTNDDSGNPMVLQFVYFDVANEIFYFAMPMSDGWLWTQLSNADGWDMGQWYFASTDVATQLADGLMSALDKQKLDGIASGAEVNVQSDWNQAVNTADDFIKNKPTIPSKVSDLNNDSGFITSPNIPYLTCATASGTAAKTTTLVSGAFTEANLVEGAQVLVKFTSANGKANPTLSVNGTTAKPIMRYGTTAPSTSNNSSWNAGSVVMLTYDGTYWQMDNYLNTTYSEISEANITNGTGSSTGLASGRRVKKAVETFAPVTDVTVAGTSALDGTTAKLAAFTGTDGVDAGTAGLVPAPATTDDGKYLKADGTWGTPSGGGGGGEIPYCTCTDAASTVAKTATVVSGTFSSLTTGAQVAVKFTYTNTATNPTLNVAGTGAKGIRRGGTAYVGTNSTQSWNAGTVVFLLYDGTDWQIVGWLNTTYDGGTGAEIIAGTSALNKVWSPQQIHDGISGMLPSIPVTDVTVGGTSVMSGTTAVVPAIPTDTGDLTNGAGYITGVTSTDTPTADTIAEFDSDAHINSADMSAQDVSDFVDGLNATGIHAVDYVVEEGTIGDSSYRKWNSGIAECWIRTSQNVAINTSYGSLYQGTWTWNFPITFIEAPTANCSHFKWGTGASWGSVSTTATTSAGLRGLDTNSRASGTTTISAYAIGKWK